MTNNSVSLFVTKYPGIEGFYFLNKTGELGYVNGEETRSVKETFPQLKNPTYIAQHPNFPQELETFHGDMAALATAYTEGTLPHTELGHVLPLDESLAWKSATLVLSQHVLDTLREDEKVLYTKGIKDPFKAESESQKFHQKRSIQRGLEDLLIHRDGYGLARYFPALFLAEKVPAGSAEPAARLRVLNLRWRRTDETKDAAPNVAALGTREEVFNLLRDNLAERGALDHQKRLENRLGLE